MWSEEVRNNIYKGLENQLDTKQFFNAADYYKTTQMKTTPTTNITNDTVAVFGKIGYVPKENSSTKNDTMYSNEIKGMSFANKVLKETRINSVKDLSMDKLRIYKIDDLLAANLVETTVIPLRMIPTNLSLVKRFEWREVLFSDVGMAFHMIKDRFFK